MSQHTPQNDVLFSEVPIGKKIRYADQSNHLTGYKIDPQQRLIPGVGAAIVNTVCCRGYAFIEDDAKVRVEHNR